MGSQPIITSEMLKRLQPLPLVAPQISTQPVMEAVNGGMPRLPMPTAQAAAPNQVMTDQGELQRLRSTGSGADQILHPLDGQPVSGLRKVGGVLAKIGDVAASALLPQFASYIPGTSAHHQQLLGQQEHRLTNDLETNQQEAQTNLLDAQPALKQSALENQTLKTQGMIQHNNDLAQHYNDQASAQLRNHGYTVDETDPTGHKIRPLKYEEMSENQQAVEDLKHAQQMQAEAQAELKKAQNDPSSPLFKQAQQKNDTALMNAKTAMGRLGLTAQSLQLRRENTNANLYGTDLNGNALPGAAQIEGDDGQLHTVGSKNASRAVKQQQAVGTFNDLSGSVQHTRQSLQALASEGGSLADPRIVQAMSDPHSTIGKVINGKLVTAGLSPTAITAINSVRQLHEQAAILRSVTGGTASEANAQRILDTVPGAGTANNDAFSRLDQLETTLKRVSPALSQVSGGLSRKVGGQATAGTVTLTSNGKTYHIPQDMVADFKKDHPNAK